MARWEPYLKRGLGALIAASDFALTMIFALVLFTATAIEFPSAMRDLLAFVKETRDLIAGERPSDTAMLWADILLQPPLAVFIFFAIITRLLFEAIYAVFNRGQFPAAPAAPPLQPAEPPAPPAASPSPFSQW